MVRDNSLPLIGVYRLIVVAFLRLNFLNDRLFMHQRPIAFPNKGSFCGFTDEYGGYLMFILRPIKIDGHS